MLFETYPPAVRTLIGELSTVEPVFTTLRQWYRELYDELCSTYPEHVGRTMDRLNEVNRIRTQIKYYDTVEFLLTEGEHMVNTFNELLTAAAIVFRELRERELFDEFDDLAFSPEDERAELERVRKTVLTLTPVHHRVQSLYLSLRELYERETPAIHTREILATEDADRLRYALLGHARDSFFWDPTAETLAEYLVAAERVEQTHPSPVDGIPYVLAQRTPERVAAFTKLKDELVSDELMLSLTEPSVQ